MNAKRKGTAREHRSMNVTDTVSFTMKQPAAVTCHGCSQDIVGVVVWSECYCGRETPRVRRLYVTDSGMFFGSGRCRGVSQPFCDRCKPSKQQSRRGCGRCGRDFVCTGKRRFCSDLCVAETRNEQRCQRPASALCRQCHTAFVPARADACYCSATCRQRAYRQRRTAA